MGLSDYLAIRINKIRKNLVTKNKLVNNEWYLINEEFDAEIYYIFENEDTLLRSTNGEISRLNYQFIIDNERIIIKDTNKSSEKLYNIKILNNDYMFLEQKSLKNLLIFVNRSKYKDISKSSARSSLLHYSKSNN